MVTQRLCSKQNTRCWSRAGSFQFFLPTQAPIAGLLLFVAALASCKCAEPGTETGPSRAPAREVVTISGSGSPEQPVDPARRRTVPALPKGRRALTPEQADVLLRYDEPPRIALEDPGQEPRIALRHTPADGDQQTIEIVIDNEMSVARGSERNAEKPPVPRLRMQLRTSVAVSKAAPGSFELAVSVADTKLEPTDAAGKAVAQQLGPLLPMLRQIEESYLLTSTGLSRRLRTHRPPGTPPDVSQLWSTVSGAVGEMFLSFPQQLVGQGARWKVLTRRSDGGADLLRLSTYRIVTLDKTTVVLAVVFREVGAQPAEPNAAVPADILLQVIRATGSGTRDITLTRGQPVVDQGETKLDSRLVIDAKPKVGTAVAGPVRTTIAIRQRIRLNRQPTKPGVP